MAEPSIRITTGETVTVGGVPVTVEMDEGELIVRIGLCDCSAEGTPYAGEYVSEGRGHVTVRVESFRPGRSQQHRFVLYAKEG
jgi:hypothetical protein